MAGKLTIMDRYKKATDMQVGQPFAMSAAPAPIPALSEQFGVLSARMQDIARLYISARQKTGESLLEMARWMSEARQEAQYGEWKIFLQATGTHANHAESLINIHATAMRDSRFAEAIRRDFLSLSAAYELISAPAEIQDRLLESQQPISRQQIRDEKQMHKVHAGVDFGRTPPATAPAVPTPAPVAPAAAPRPAWTPTPAARAPQDPRAAARAFLNDQSKALERYASSAMVSQADYRRALDHIAALLTISTLEE